MSKFLIFGTVVCVIAGSLYFYGQRKNIPAEEISGLLVETLIEGAGEPAKEGDELTIHYTLWFDNGDRFESSLDSGNPYVFILGSSQLIEGWNQGLLGAKVGETRKLNIPYNLAYGELGMVLSSGDVVIPSKTSLIFEIEVLDIQ